MAHLTSDAFDIVELLQPYNRWDEPNIGQLRKWLSILNDLWNTDKHRVPQVVLLLPSGLRFGTGLKVDDNHRWNTDPNVPLEDNSDIASYHFPKGETCFTDVEFRFDLTFDEAGRDDGVLVNRTMLVNLYNAVRTVLFEKLGRYRSLQLRTHAAPLETSLLVSGVPAINETGQVSDGELPFSFLRKRAQGRNLT